MSLPAQMPVGLHILIQSDEVDHTPDPNPISPDYAKGCRVVIGAIHFLDINGDKVQHVLEVRAPIGTSDDKIVKLLNMTAAHDLEGALSLLHRVLSNERMGFGEAIAALNQGGRVHRAGWNGKGMWLHLQRPDAHSKMTQPYIYMHTAQGDLIPWLASQADVLANDWQAILGPPSPQG